MSDLRPTPEFRDALGRTFAFDAPPHRVVSLVPSLTETLFELGAGAQVAGITDWCIFPQDLDRPRVGGTKNPDVEAIRSVAPDLVYVNLEENLERYARQIESFAQRAVAGPTPARRSGRRQDADRHRHLRGLKGAA